MADKTENRPGEKPRTLAVILAGGLSSRMGGQEKTLLSLSGEPLIAHAIRRLKPQVERIAINANGNPSRFAQFDLPVIADITKGSQGPLAGILTGLTKAHELGFDEIVTAAGDSPFIPGDLVARLRSACDTTDSARIALAATKDLDRGLRRHPTFGLWPVDLADDLQQALVAGTRKVVSWADQHGVAVAEFGTGPPDPFFNVNRPDDLVQAACLLSEQSR